MHLFRLSHRHTHAAAPESPGRVPAGSEARLLARRLVSAGLGPTAVLLLRALRPLHWLGGQAIYVAQPFVESFGERRRLGSTLPDLASFFEREGSVDELLRELESSGRSREADGRS